MNVLIIGLGVIGTKPDIRFHFDAERLGELTDLQKNIVASAVKTVKKGGLLVYSTCSPVILRKLSSAAEEM